MRVLYCTDTHPPQVNGVSVVIHRSIAGLTARGWEVAVVGPRYPARERARSVFPPAAASRTLELPSVGFPPYPEIRLALPDYRAIARLVREFRPDLVHSVTEFAIGRVGQLVARRFGVPSVSSYHTDFGRYMERWGVAPLRQPVSRYLARFHGRSGRVYTPSAASAAELRALGVERVEVWGCGVDPIRFTPARRGEAIRARLGLGDRFVFLHVGRLAPEKSVEVLLAGFGRVVERFGAERVALVVGGEGPSREALERAAPPGTRFVGYLDRRHLLPDLYAAADAFLFASVTETLGLVVLEAMASGLPVVAVPAGGVAEHLRPGQNGLTFDPGDDRQLAFRMEELVSRPALARRLNEGARRWAEGFGWEGELDRLDLSYRRFLAPASPTEAAWDLAVAGV